MASDLNAETTLYTGPLSVAAACGRTDRPKDTGEHTVVALGIAISMDEQDHGRRLRVRMEMTPEDAEEVAANLLCMVVAAKAGRA